MRSGRKPCAAPGFGYVEVVTDDTQVELRWAVARLVRGVWRI